MSCFMIYWSAPGRHGPHNFEYVLVKELIGIAARCMLYSIEP